MAAPSYDQKSVFNVALRAFCALRTVAVGAVRTTVEFTMMDDAHLAARPDRPGLDLAGRGKGGGGQKSPRGGGTRCEVGGGRRWGRSWGRKEVVARPPAACWNDRLHGVPFGQDTAKPVSLSAAGSQSRCQPESRRRPVTSVFPHAYTRCRNNPARRSHEEACPGDRDVRAQRTCSRAGGDNRGVLLPGAGVLHPRLPDVPVAIGRECP